MGYNLVSKKERIMALLPRLGGLMTNERFADLYYTPLKASNSNNDGEVAQQRLSEQTRRGLTESSFEFMTKVQSTMLPSALSGNNIIAQAVTGSGKTLGYMVPVIERLVNLGYHDKVKAVGALILVPTRELADQAWDVCKSIGHAHHLSGASFFGGQHFREQRARVNRQAPNICIGTPGRIVQHMQQTELFDLSTCEIIVLDEVDRLLDEGFMPQIKLIVKSHGSGCGRRQMILTSATMPTDGQLKQLKLHKLTFDRFLLGETGLTDIGAKASSRLKQWVAVVPIQHKLDFLMSFVKVYSKDKILIFTETVKMVKLLAELMRLIFPKTNIFEFHGKASMNKRFDGIGEFSRHEGSSVMISTDLAERGVDIPGINWVFQFDMPSKIETYVHRVGRTARLNAKGNSIILCCPHEKHFLMEIIQKMSYQIRLFRFNKTSDYRLASPVSIKKIFAEESYKQIVDKAMISIMKSPLGPRHYSKDQIRIVATSYGLTDDISYYPSNIE